MKKVLYILATIVEMAALAGVYLLNYFARAKLGMNRWLGYHNSKWEEALPIQGIEWIAMLVLVLLLVSVLVLLSRKSRKGPVAVASAVLACVVVAAAVLFAFLHSIADYRAYYLMALCFGLAALLQLLKSLAIVASKPRSQE